MLARSERARTWASRNHPCAGCGKLGKPRKSGLCNRCSGIAERMLVSCPRCCEKFWPWYDGMHKRKTCRPCVQDQKKQAAKRAERRRLQRESKAKPRTAEERAEYDRVKARAYYATHQAASVARVKAYKRKNPDRNLDWSHRRRAKMREGFVAPVSILTVMRSRKSCIYCRCRLRKGMVTIDHLVPIARGGAHADFNLVPACRKCNSRKADRPMVQWLAMLPQERRAIVGRLYARRRLSQGYLPLTLSKVGGYVGSFRDSAKIAGQTGADSVRLSPNS